MWLLELLMDNLRSLQSNAAPALQPLETLPAVYLPTLVDGDAVSMECSLLIQTRSAVIRSVPKNPRMKSSWSTLSTMRMLLLRPVTWSQVPVVMSLAQPKVLRTLSMMCRNVQPALHLRSAFMWWKRCSQLAITRIIPKHQRTTTRPTTLLTLFLLLPTSMLQAFHSNWSTTSRTRPFALSTLQRTMPTESCMAMAHSQETRTVTWPGCFHACGAEKMLPAFSEIIRFAPGLCTILRVVTLAWCHCGSWMSHLWKIRTFWYSALWLPSPLVFRLIGACQGFDELQNTSVADRCRQYHAIPTSLVGAFVLQCLCCCPKDVSSHSSVRPILCQFRLVMFGTARWRSKCEQIGGRKMSARCGHCRFCGCAGCACSLLVRFLHWLLHTSGPLRIIWDAHSIQLQILEVRVTLCDKFGIDSTLLQGG